MARINTKPRRYNRTVSRNQLRNHPDRTVNHEGGLAFNLDKYTELYQRVASCMLGEKKFYVNSKHELEHSDDRIIELIHDIAQENPEFILKLAAFTRNVLNLRTISQAILGEAAFDENTKPFVRRYTPHIVRRADELAEVVAYIQSQIGDLGDRRDSGSLPNSLKRGLADTFHNFNEYQLAKYNNSKSAVKLKDVWRLVHPIPTSNDEMTLWARLLNDKLAIPDTWEAYISVNGSNKQTWEHIIPSMPIFAIVRNLRNFLDNKVSTRVLERYVIDDKLTNRDRILHSKMFPFRFLSAYKEIENHSNPNARFLLEALEQSMDISVENLPRIEGLTAIFADHSGSMTDKPISEKSSVYPKDIADVLLAVADQMCEKALIGVFADDARTVADVKRRDGVLNNSRKIGSVNVGGSTNAHLTLDILTKHHLDVDRVIMLTDEQTYDSNGRSNSSPWSGRSVAESLKTYKRQVNPNVYFYPVNLMGYGTTVVPKDEPHVCQIAGWSENILRYIPLFENTGQKVIDQINKYDPTRSGREEDD